MILRTKKNENSLWLRLTAGSTLFLFLMTQSFSSGFNSLARAAEIPGITPPNSFERMDKIEIPESLGSIEGFFQGGTDNTVVVVQDAHSIPDAQKSIQRIIQYFQSEYGVTTVGLEGASSQLDSQIFRSFPDKKLLKKVLRDYLLKGELSGGTAAAIFSEKHPTEFYGVEDWKLYEEGIHLYQKAMSEEQSLSQKVKEEIEKIHEEKKSLYSQPLLEVDRLLSDFNNGRADLSGVLIKLAEVKRPAVGTELAALLEEIEREGADQSSVEAEVGGIAEEIKQQVIRHKSQVSSEIIKELNGKTQAFQTGHLSAQAFALALRELLESEAVFYTGIEDKVSRYGGKGGQARLSEKLTRLSGQQKTLREIEGTKFFSVFETYARSVKESLMTREAERALDRESRRADLYEKMAKAELTREEWEELKGRHKTHAPRPMFKKNISMMEVAFPSVYSSAKQGMSEEGDWLAGFKDHVAFYENAVARDAAFLRNLSQLAFNRKSFESGKTPAPRSAILVAGGFHARGVTQRLEEQGMSYLLVVPAIKKIPEETNYQAHMRGDVSWKSYFEVEKGKVSLYKAFVRSVRDRLLAVSVQPEEDRLESSEFKANRVTLKVWRDQIIRDLAERGRVEDAGHYIQYLDERVNKTSKPKVTPEALVRVEHFIAGLKDLKQKGLVTSQNILGILKPSTAIPPSEGPLMLSPEWVPAAMLIRSEVRGGPRSVTAKPRFASDRRQPLGASKADDRLSAENELQRIAAERHEAVTRAMTYLEQFPSPPKIDIYVFNQVFNGVYGGAYLLARELRQRIRNAQIRILLVNGTLPNSFPARTEGIEIKQGVNLDSGQLADEPSDFNFVVSGSSAYKMPVLPKESTVVLRGFRHDWDENFEPVQRGLPNIHMNFSDPHSTVTLVSENNTAVLHKDTLSFDELVLAKEDWHERFAQDSNGFFGNGQWQALQDFSSKNQWRVGQAVLSWAYYEDMNYFQREMEKLIEAVLSGTFEQQELWTSAGKQIVIHTSVSHRKVHPLVRFLEDRKISFIDFNGELHEGSLPITLVLHERIPHALLQELQVLSGTMTSFNDENGENHWIGFPGNATGWSSSHEAMSLGLPWLHDRFDISANGFTEAFEALTANVLRLHEGRLELLPGISGMTAQNLAAEFLMGGNRKIARYDNLEGWSRLARWYSQSLFQMNMADDVVITLARQKGLELTSSSERVPNVPIAEFFLGSPRGAQSRSEMRIGETQNSDAQIQVRQLLAEAPMQEGSPFAADESQRLQRAVMSLVEKIASLSLRPAAVLTMPGSGKWAGQLLKTAWQTMYPEQALEFHEINGENWDEVGAALALTQDPLIVLDDAGKTLAAINKIRPDLERQLGSERLFFAVLYAGKLPANPEAFISDYTTTESQAIFRSAYPYLFNNHFLYGEQVDEQVLDQGLPFWHLVRKLGKTGIESPKLREVMEPAAYQLLFDSVQAAREKTLGELTARGVNVISIQRARQMAEIAGAATADKFLEDWLPVFVRGLVSEIQQTPPFQLRLADIPDDQAPKILHDFRNVVAPVYAYAQQLLDNPELPADSPNRRVLESFFEMLQPADLLREKKQSAEVAEVTQMLEVYRGFASDPKNLSVFRAAFEELGESEEYIRKVETSLTRTFKNIREFSGDDPVRGTGLQELLEEIVLMDVSGADLVRDYQTPEHAEIRTRQHKFSRVILNIIRNAREAMEENRSGGRIYLRTKFSETGNLIIDIEDEGVGIPEDKLLSIWEPDYTTKLNGTGLGLASVKEIVEESLGGSIKVRSVLGKGTVFTIEMPLRAEPTPLKIYQPPSDEEVLDVILDQDEGVSQKRQADFFTAAQTLYSEIIEFLAEQEIIQGGKLTKKAERSQWHNPNGALRNAQQALQDENAQLFIEQVRLFLDLSQQNLSNQAWVDPYEEWDLKAKSLTQMLLGDSSPASRRSEVRNFAALMETQVEAMMLYSPSMLDSSDLQLDEYDQEHYEFVPGREDARVGYWRRKGMPPGKELILGTWQDVEKKYPPLYSDNQTMKRHVVTRYKTPGGQSRSFYFYDDHVYSVPYALEALERAALGFEVLAQEGLTHLFLDDHTDRTLVPKVVFPTSFEGAIQLMADHQTLNGLRMNNFNAFWKPGLFSTHSHLYDKSVARETHSERLSGAVRDEAPLPGGAIAKSMDAPLYFTMQERPRTNFSQVFLDIDTDVNGGGDSIAKPMRPASEIFNFYGDFFRRLFFEDGVVPALFHASTTSGQGAPYGDVEIVRYLARMAPLFFMLGEMYSQEEILASVSAIGEEHKDLLGGRRSEMRLLAEKDGHEERETAEESLALPADFFSAPERVMADPQAFEALAGRLQANVFLQAEFFDHFKLTDLEALETFKEKSLFLREKETAWRAEGKELSSEGELWLFNRYARQGAYDEAVRVYESGVNQRFLESDQVRADYIYALNRLGFNEVLQGAYNLSRNYLADAGEKSQQFILSARKKNEAESGADRLMQAIRGTIDLSDESLAALIDRVNRYYRGDKLFINTSEQTFRDDTGILIPKLVRLEFQGKAAELVQKVKKKVTDAVHQELYMSRAITHKNYYVLVNFIDEELKKEPSVRDPRFGAWLKIYQRAFKTAGLEDPRFLTSLHDRAVLELNRAYNGFSAAYEQYVLSAYAGSNVIRTLLYAGWQEEARAMAPLVRAAAQKSDPKAFWTQAVLLETSLVVGDKAAVLHDLAAVLRLARNDSETESLLRHLKLWRAKAASEAPPRMLDAVIQVLEFSVMEENSMRETVLQRVGKHIQDSEKISILEKSGMSRKDLIRVSNYLKKARKVSLSLNKKNRLLEDSVIQLAGYHRGIVLLNNSDHGGAIPDYLLNRVEMDFMRAFLEYDIEGQGALRDENDRDVVERHVDQFIERIYHLVDELGKRPLRDLTSPEHQDFDRVSEAYLRFTGSRLSKLDATSVLMAMAIGHGDCRPTNILKERIMGGYDKYKIARRIREAKTFWEQGRQRDYEKKVEELLRLTTGEHREPAVLQAEILAAAAAEKIYEIDTVEGVDGKRPIKTDSVKLLESHVLYTELAYDSNNKLTGIWLKDVWYRWDDATVETPKDNSSYDFGNRFIPLADIRVVKVPNKQGGEVETLELRVKDALIVYKDVTGKETELTDVFLRIQSKYSGPKHIPTHRYDEETAYFSAHPVIVPPSADFFFDGSSERFYRVLKDALHGFMGTENFARQSKVLARGGTRSEVRFSSEDTRNALEERSYELVHFFRPTLDEREKKEWARTLVEGTDLHDRGEDTFFSEQELALVLGGPVILYLSALAALVGFGLRGLGAEVLIGRLFVTVAVSLTAIFSYAAAAVYKPGIVMPAFVDRRGRSHLYLEGDLKKQIHEGDPRTIGYLFHEWTHQLARGGLINDDRVVSAVQFLKRYELAKEKSKEGGEEMGIKQFSAQIAADKEPSGFRGFMRRFWWGHSAQWSEQALQSGYQAMQSFLANPSDEARHNLARADRFQLRDLNGWHGVQGVLTLGLGWENYSRAIRYGGMAAAILDDPTRGAESARQFIVRLSQSSIARAETAVAPLNNFRRSEMRTAIEGIASPAGVDSLRRNGFSEDQAWLIYQAAAWMLRASRGDSTQQPLDEADLEKINNTLQNVYKLNFKNFKKPFFEPLRRHGLLTPWFFLRALLEALVTYAQIMNQGDFLAGGMTEGKYLYIHPEIARTPAGLQTIIIHELGHLWLADHVKKNGEISTDGEAYALLHLMKENIPLVLKNWLYWLHSPPFYYGLEQFIEQGIEALRDEKRQGLPSAIRAHSDRLGHPLEPLLALGSMGRHFFKVPEYSLSQGEKTAVFFDWGIQLAGQAVALFGDSKPVTVKEDYDLPAYRLGLAAAFVSSINLAGYGSDERYESVERILAGAQTLSLFEAAQMELNRLQASLSTSEAPLDFVRPTLNETPEWMSPLKRSEMRQLEPLDGRSQAVQNLQRSGVLISLADSLIDLVRSLLKKFPDEIQDSDLKFDLYSNLEGKDRARTAQMIQEKFGRNLAEERIFPEKVDAMVTFYENKPIAIYLFSRNASQAIHGQRIYLADQYRRRGVADRLYSALLMAAVDGGVDNFYASISATEAAQGFHGSFEGRPGFYFLRSGDRVDGLHVNLKEFSAAIGQNGGGASASLTARRPVIRAGEDLLGREDRKRSEVRMTELSVDVESGISRSAFAIETFGTLVQVGSISPHRARALAALSEVSLGEVIQHLERLLKNAQKEQGEERLKNTAYVTASIALISEILGIVRKLETFYPEGAAIGLAIDEGVEAMGTQQIADQHARALANLSGLISRMIVIGRLPKQFQTKLDASGYKGMKLTLEGSAKNVSAPDGQARLPVVEVGDSLSEAAVIPPEILRVLLGSEGYSFEADTYSFYTLSTAVVLQYAYSVMAALKLKKGMDPSKISEELLAQLNLQTDNAFFMEGDKMRVMVKAVQNLINAFQARSEIRKSA